MILNPEGYVSKNASGGNDYNYYLKDHLGNNRSVIKASQTAHGGTLQEIDYYPFGMPHPVVLQPRDGINPEKQPYKFGGKELDEMHGLNWYDQGARPFGAIIPITPTMDPLCEKYYSVSPYVQWGNNPVNVIDPTGMDTVWVHSDGSEMARIKANGDEVMVVNDPLPEVTVTAPAPSSTSFKIMAGTLVAVGTLSADDIRGIGIADDPAIPVVLVGGALLAGSMWLNEVFTAPYPQYRTPNYKSDFSKTARGNHRDDGLEDLSNEDIAAELKNLKGGHLSKEQKAQKQRLEKEQKARTERNKQKKGLKKVLEPEGDNLWNQLK